MSNADPASDERLTDEAVEAIAVCLVKMGDDSPSWDEELKLFQAAATLTSLLAERTADKARIAEMEGERDDAILDRQQLREAYDRRCLDYGIAEARASDLEAQVAALSATIDAQASVIGEAIIWHEAQDKALSKQPPSGDRGWRRCEHQEQAAALRAALTPPEETPDGA